MSAQRSKKPARSSAPKGERGSRSSKDSLRKTKKPLAHASEWWELRLYVAGQTPRSVEAFANLQKLCEQHLQGRYRITVIDLLVNPTLARGDQILAVPTLVRQLPPPVKKIIGDFSDEERVLVGLNLRPLKTAAARKR